MSATADRRARARLRLSAAAGCLVLMTIGLADLSLASAFDPGTRAERASPATSDAGHSDSCSSHTEHADESDIPVVDVPDGLGPARRHCSYSSEGGTALTQSPPVRPPSF
jgi:hypothetical protein